MTIILEPCWKRCDNLFSI